MTSSPTQPSDSHPTRHLSANSDTARLLLAHVVWCRSPPCIPRCQHCTANPVIACKTVNDADPEARSRSAPMPCYPLLQPRPCLLGPPVLTCDRHRCANPAPARRARFGAKCIDTVSTPPTLDPKCPDAHTRDSFGCADKHQPIGATPCQTLQNTHALSTPPSLLSSLKRPHPCLTVAALA